MTTLQQPFVSPKTELKKTLRTTFSTDDDLFLPVSIYLDSSEERSEIIASVAEVLRAYGFSNFASMYQAPGSFYIHIEAGFDSKDRQVARKRKEELKADLLSDKPSKHTARQRAVKKVKESLWKRAGKRLKTGVLFGTLFLGSVVGGVFKDVIKDESEKWLEQQGPNLVQKLDAVVAKDLPLPLAHSFHTAVKGYIEKSPHKSPLEAPPPK